MSSLTSRQDICDRADMAAQSTTATEHSNRGIHQAGPRSALVPWASSESDDLSAQYHGLVLRDVRDHTSYADAGCASDPHETGARALLLRAAVRCGQGSGQFNRRDRDNCVSSLRSDILRSTPFANCRSYCTEHSRCTVLRQLADSSKILSGTIRTM